MRWWLLLTLTALLNQQSFAASELETLKANYKKMQEEMSVAEFCRSEAPSFRVGGLLKTLEQKPDYEGQYRFMYLFTFDYGSGTHTFFMRTDAETIPYAESKCYGFDYAGMCKYLFSMVNSGRYDDPNFDKLTSISCTAPRHP